MRPDRDAALVQAAFRDLHGRRLHGFSLLVALGNRSVASSAASRALGEGARQAAQLRHPERAAAWLRARVLHLLPRDPGRLTHETEPERRATLRALGVADEVFDALASLPTLERAALVVSAIEQLDEHDMETVLGRRDAELRRLITRARSTYLVVAAEAMPSGAARATLEGPLAARVTAAAVRTIGGAAPA
jgi:hypothetical protein